ncbi:MAG: ferredoxin family protein [Candidatus Eremiobacterota bacterium]
MNEFPEIDGELCIGCKACVAICPNDVIAIGEDEKAKVVRPDVCQKKEECANICPTEAIVLPWKE